ncbi:hypothetical protein SDC9_168607 [bioreactor metagenome]|uniref:Uncharacterized protein n=1 Tax=bioreactor metagenome TaxID=1076179 RepID=A0A645G2Z3_9ZZZZ
MRGQMPAVEVGRAQAGSQREHHFDSGTGDDPGAVHLGIIQHLGGHPEGVGDHRLKVQTLPLGHQLR